MMTTSQLIGTLYQKLLRPGLFRLDPELVHDHFLALGRALGEYRITRELTRNLFSYQSDRLTQQINGLDFPNPVGLSAGFDKDANLIKILPAVGFGFMQVGSVTLHPYEGNPKPRLYRLPKSQGLVVYYGLKNIGVEAIVQKVKDDFSAEVPVSISVAKTNSSTTADIQAGIDDYLSSLRYLNDHGVGDIYTVNISCPNPYGGEPYTTPERLELLLNAVDRLVLERPVWLKLPVDQEWSEFAELLAVADRHRIAGVVIGNLTKDRTSPAIKDPIPARIKGGISGRPTWERSNSLIGRTYEKYGDRFVIVGVGGIFSAEDAYQKIKLGASLVQLITGMVYQGPQVIGEINRGLERLLKEDGYDNIRQAVGAHFH